MLPSLAIESLITFHLQRILYNLYLTTRWHLVQRRPAIHAIRVNIAPGLMWRCVHLALLERAGLHGVGIVIKALPLSSFAKAEAQTEKNYEGSSGDADA